MFQTAQPIDINLNIYDLHESNRVLHNLGVGFFHTGVEINGYEFSFSASGVIRTRPRLPEFGNFREQVRIGTYSDGMNGIYNIISTLRNAGFQPNAYHPVNLNCNHFSEAFCMAAVNQHIPEWVNRMAGMGSNFAAPATAASKTGDSLPAPGVVKAPQQPVATITGTQTTSTNANNSKEVAQDSSLVSSIFGWFGWGAENSTRTISSGSTPVTGQQEPKVLSGVDKKVAPSAKKELTVKQKELLAKMKN